MIDLEKLRGNLSARPGRYYGVTVGIVTNNEDPDKMARVKVRLPWLSDDDESFWARVASPMAGNSRGFFCLPEVDDEVLVAFEHGHVEYPYVVGALWNGKDAPPEDNSDSKNNKRAWVSRAGSVIRFDDTDGSETIEISDKSGEAKITIDAHSHAVTVVCSGALKLQGKTIEISADESLKITAGSSAEVTANTNLKLKGLKVDIN